MNVQKRNSNCNKEPANLIISPLTTKAAPDIPGPEIAKFSSEDCPQRVRNPQCAKRGDRDDLLPDFLKHSAHFAVPKETKLLSQCFDRFAMGTIWSRFRPKELGKFRWGSM